MSVYNTLYECIRYEPVLQFFPEYLFTSVNIPIPRVALLSAKAPFSVESKADLKMHGAYLEFLEYSTVILHRAPYCSALHICLISR